MKSFAFASLAALAFADASDFPSDDSRHAYCHVNAEFDGISCDNLWALMDYEIRSWDSDTTSPSGGVYSIYEEQVNQYIWSTRLTRDKNYVDDQLFELTSTSTGCSVTGRSKSESMSYYDYSVNFCNLWNVYNGVGNTFNYSVPQGECPFPADDPVTTCARY